MSNIVPNPHNLDYRNIGEFFSKIYAAQNDEDLTRIFKSLVILPRTRNNVHRLSGSEIARVRGMLRKRMKELGCYELANGEFRTPIAK